MWGLRCSTCQCAPHCWHCGRCSTPQELSQGRGWWSLLTKAHRASDRAVRDGKRQRIVRGVCSNVVLYRGRARSRASLPCLPLACMYPSAVHTPSHKRTPGATAGGLDASSAKSRTHAHVPFQGAPQPSTFHHPDFPGLVVASKSSVVGQLARSRIRGAHPQPEWGATRLALKRRSAEGRAPAR